MIRLVAGFLLGAILSASTSAPGIVMMSLLVVGIVAQHGFARLLYRHMRGVDPVALGARSLQHLRAILPVPLHIILMDFTAKASLWGAVSAFLALTGWLRIECAGC